MKVAIVVPYSWSFWGGVVDHAEQQLLALRALGVEAWLVMGNDPPGSFTHLLHPGLGRHVDPPDYVLPVGRSVIVPANGSLPNIVLSPPSIGRVKRILQRGSLLHQLLRLLRIVPEVGIFGEFVQLREARRGCIDVKDASSAARPTA